jgi:chemotaxis protein CheD
MKVLNNKKGKSMYVIYPGDFHAVREDCYLGSIIGQSVLVCLYDESRGIGGMGNFIVPGTIGAEDIIADNIARQGIYCMELLMAEIVKLGGDRRYLKAKLFGAGYINDNFDYLGEVSDSNIRFLHDYFNMEKIQIKNQDLGGNFRRKVYFYPVRGIAYRQFQRRDTDSLDFKRLEKEYIDRMFREKNKTGEVILF